MVGWLAAASCRWVWVIATSSLSRRCLNQSLLPQQLGDLLLSCRVRGLFRSAPTRRLREGYTSPACSIRSGSKGANPDLVMIRSSIRPFFMSHSLWWRSTTNVMVTDGLRLSCAFLVVRRSQMRLSGELHVIMLWASNSTAHEFDGSMPRKSGRHVWAV